MTPLETYLTRVREIRGAGGGQVETSYYGALENLFNEYGKALKPKQLRQNDGPNLFPAAIRIIEEVRPRTVMIENVRGFLDGFSTPA